MSVFFLFSFVTILMGGGNKGWDLRCLMGIRKLPCLEEPWYNETRLFPWGISPLDNPTTSNLAGGQAALN